MGRAKNFWRVFCELPYIQLTRFSVYFMLPCCNVQLIKRHVLPLRCFANLICNNFLLLRPLFNIIEEWLRLLLLPTNFQKPELPIQFKRASCIISVAGAAGLKIFVSNDLLSKLLCIPVLNLLVEYICPCPPKTQCMPLADGQLG